MKDVLTIEIYPEDADLQDKAIAIIRQVLSPAQRQHVDFFWTRNEE